MQRYQVQKEVRSEASILRLKLRAFYVFFGIFLLLVFMLLGNFSFTRFVVAVVLTVAAYSLILLLQNINLDTYIPILPKSLINK